MKKMRFFVVLFVTLSIILTACGGAPADSGDKGDKIVLEFWSMWNVSEPQALALQKYIEAFEAEHPNIKINATWNGRENQTKLRSALAGGTKVDFMDQDADQIAGGLMAEGMGYKLNDYLKQPSLDYDGTVADAFLPGVIDLHKTGDDYYLFPYVYNTWQFWTNMDIVNEVGVTEHPQTWDEFLALSQKIKDAGYVVLAAEGSEFTYNFPYYVYLVARLKGPGFLLKAVEDTTGEAWNDPVFLQAAEMIRELWDKGFIPPETAGYVWPAGQMTLATGDAAMEMCGSWLPTELRDTAGEDFNWGGLRFPNVDGGVGNIDDLTAWLLSFMILKDTEHPDEVFEFLKFTQTKANSQIMSDEALVGVTRKEVSWPTVLKDGEAAASSATTAMLPNDGIQAFYPEYQETVLTPAFNKFFTLGATPEEFIQTMVKDSAAYWASK